MWFQIIMWFKYNLLFLLRFQTSNLHIVQYTVCNFSYCIKYIYQIYENVFYNIQYIAR